ncbi:hypothetical protein ACHWQZ_G012214 [Mnemiopsis leidyi]
MESSERIKDLSIKIKTVLGNLLKNADSISKRVLTLFDPSADFNVNVAKLEACNRPELDCLGGYLKIPLFQARNPEVKLYSSKHKIAKRIVMEIKSLYPTICTECDGEYKVMQGHQSQTRCWICLQGAHDCVEFTTQMEIMQSACAIPSGVVWLCHDCLILNNPFPKTAIEDSGLKSGINTPSSKAQTPDISGTSATNDSLSKEVDKPTPNSSLVAEKLADKLEDVLTDQKKSESKPNTCSHVCPRLMEGTCPHGVSGKKTAGGKEKCELFHPKRCYKYMSYYTHATKGCTKGDDCDSLHVNLCESSVTTKKCGNVACKAMHLVEITSRLDKMESTLGDNMKLTVQREMAAVRAEFDIWKQQLDMLKMAINSQPMAYNPAMAYYGPFKPTPYEMPQCHQLRMQQDRFPSQHQPQIMTPIPPACY